eukprot:SAG31_NODE_336_length_17493_cov_20.694032_11_plen_197_part_00
MHSIETYFLSRFFAQNYVLDMSNGSHTDMYSPQTFLNHPLKPDTLVQSYADCAAACLEIGEVAAHDCELISAIYCLNAVSAVDIVCKGGNRGRWCRHWSQYGELSGRTRRPLHSWVQLLPVGGRTLHIEDTADSAGAPASKKTDYHTCLILCSRTGKQDSWVYHPFDCSRQIHAHVHCDRHQQVDGSRIMHLNHCR